MALALKSKELLSRVIRTNLSNAKSGKGLLAATLEIAKPRIIGKPVEDGNILTRLAKWVFSGLGGFIGWAVGALWNAALNLTWGTVKFTFTSVWGMIVGAAQALWQFDWNASDKSLKASIANQNIALAATWGGVAGQSFGWLAGIGVGYGVSLVVPVIGGALLARSIAATVGREALEELAASFTAALRITARTLAKSAITNAYISFRQMVKRTDRKTLEKFLGKDAANTIKDQWGNEGGPNGSIAVFVDNKVEGIKNKALSAFIEEFLEESWDSFVEAGFIVAQELDSAAAQNKLSTQKQLGTERTLTLQPDNRVKGEVLTFANVPQNLLMPAVQQTINTHRLVNNRDIGQFVGALVEDYARAMPLALRAQIKLFSVKEPPYVSTKGRRITEVTVSIPDVRRTKLDWEAIKAACGGVNGYMWGRYKATAQLSNGRPFVVYGATADGAEENLKRFLLLSTAEITTINVAEELKEGARLTNPRLQKEAARVYPGYITIINRDLQLATDKGLPTKKGNYRDRSTRIELWGSQKPFDFEEVIRDVLKKSEL